MAPLAQIPGVRLYSLQKDCDSLELEECDALRGVSQTLPSCGDLEGIAAAIGLLDAVVTIDTSFAHLAGAVGKRGFVLLPFSPDWRWLRGRQDSPWYPALTLFRQQQPGDWSSPMRSVVQSLLELQL